MPYISQAERTPIEPHLKQASKSIGTVGQLTYAITYLLLAFLGRRPNYERYALALGALSASSHELYRTEVGPYENGKRGLHGDVRSPLDTTTHGW